MDIYTRCSIACEMYSKDEFYTLKQENKRQYVLSLIVERVRLARWLFQSSFNRYVGEMFQPLLPYWGEKEKNQMVVGV
ncbi:hypothetical protein V1477_017951 [Vespula maculifrons]|uniref:Uncharacterized protein n=1 Tax=Vespula maculifrons TaxID=7453 RepID=A0ABD2AZT6_VESMC